MSWGMFGKMFGGKETYPELDPGHPARQQLDQIRDPLASLANDCHDRMEIVPTIGGAYIFIGKPPKKFGVAWIEENQVQNLQSMGKELGLEPIVLQGLGEKLRVVYERHMDAARYRTRIADREMTVTFDDDLAKEVSAIIKSVAH